MVLEGLEIVYLLFLKIYKIALSHPGTPKWKLQSSNGTLAGEVKIHVSCDDIVLKRTPFSYLDNAKNLLERS